MVKLVNMRNLDSSATFVEFKVYLHKLLCVNETVLKPTFETFCYMKRFQHCIL